MFYPKTFIASSPESGCGFYIVKSQGRIALFAVPVPYMLRVTFPSSCSILTSRHTAIHIYIYVSAFLLSFLLIAAATPPSAFYLFSTPHLRLGRIQSG